MSNIKNRSLPGGKDILLPNLQVTNKKFFYNTFRRMQDLKKIFAHSVILGDSNVSLKRSIYTPGRPFRPADNSGRILLRPPHDFGQEFRVPGTELSQTWATPIRGPILFAVLHYSCDLSVKGSPGKGFTPDLVNKYLDNLKRFIKRNRDLMWKFLIIAPSPDSPRHLKRAQALEQQLKGLAPKFSVIVIEYLNWANPRNVGIHHHKAISDRINSNGCARYRWN